MRIKDRVQSIEFQIQSLKDSIALTAINRSIGCNSPQYSKTANIRRCIVLRQELLALIKDLEKGE